MTRLLLAAWLPARFVTSCLQNASAMKQDKILKSGRTVEWERKQCVSASGRRTKSSQGVCVIQWGEVDIVVEVRREGQSGERVVLIVTVRRTGRRRRINIIICE